MQTALYVRKPFEVEAVRVNRDNIDEVMLWCGATLMDGHDLTNMYLSVPVKRPLTERQTQARLGDWILKTGDSYKIYTDRAFRDSFVAKFKVDANKRK